MRGTWIVLLLLSGCIAPEPAADDSAIGTEPTINTDSEADNGTVAPVFVHRQNGSFVAWAGADEVGAGSSHNTTWSLDQALQMASLVIEVWCDGDNANPYRNPGFEARYAYDRNGTRQPGTIGHGADDQGRNVICNDYRVDWAAHEGVEQVRLDELQIRIELTGSTDRMDFELAVSIFEGPIPDGYTGLPHRIGGAGGMDG